MRESPLLLLALVTPALVAILALFVYPLGYSAVTALIGPDGKLSFVHIALAWELYSVDVLFTLAIIVIATVLIALFSILIGGYLTLGENPIAVAILRWLYRWPLFVPFIVAAQCMRTFLAKNGMMNNTFIALGLMEPDSGISLLNWVGIIVTFVWKQTPFVALLVAGAMAALDASTIEAARNLGASRPRILIQIIVPQVHKTLFVGLVLSFVTMLSVLSVPIMISGQTPTTITVDMAFRINAYQDYGVANALGFMSYAMAGLAAWFYLRHGLAEKERS